MELDGETIRLQGVHCPDPTSEPGRDAKALLNTFLRAGHVRCKITTAPDGKHGLCVVNDKSINEGMGKSGHCTHLDPGEALV